METTLLTVLFTLLTASLTFYSYTLKKKIQTLADHISEKTANNVEVINSATHNFNSRLSTINVNRKTTADQVAKLAEDSASTKAVLLEVWTHLEDLTTKHNAICEQCNQMDKELSKCKSNCPCPAAKPIYQWNQLTTASSTTKNNIHNSKKNGKK